MVKLPPKGKVPERFRSCSTHLAWLAAEKEVQELEKQCAAQQELESRLKLMQNRLKAMRQGSSARLDAVMQMIEHRKAELLLVKEKLKQLEARKDEPPKYPALTNAQPLGLALAQAVKEMRKRTLSRKREEPNPLSLKQPAAWPSVYSIADLWLAKAELEHALAWRLDASDKSRPKRYVQSPELLLDSALDTANELIRLSSPGVVHETLRREALIQRDIAAGLRLMRDRMCLVIDSLGPMVRALGVQEMKHCEQTLELKKLLLAIAQEESVWGMQHKAQASAEGRPIKHLNSETYMLRRSLQKICYAPPGSAVEEDMDAVWKAVKSKEVFDLAAARTEAERLRLKVAGCELTMRRSDVKQNALAVTSDNDARAFLQTVQAKVKEATDVLHAYAEWASKTEASLILCGLTSPPSAGALEAVPANPMTLEAQRLRKALQGIIEAALITRKRPGRNGGKVGSPTSAPQAEEANAQPVDEAAKRHSAPVVSEPGSPQEGHSASSRPTSPEVRTRSARSSPRTPKTADPNRFNTS